MYKINIASFHHVPSESENHRKCAYFTVAVVTYISTRKTKYPIESCRPVRQQLKEVGAIPYSTAVSSTGFSSHHLRMFHTRSVFFRDTPCLPAEHDKERNLAGSIRGYSHPELVSYLLRAVFCPPLPLHPPSFVLRSGEVEKGSFSRTRLWTRQSVDVGELSPEMRF